MANLDPHRPILRSRRLDTSRLLDTPAKQKGRAIDVPYADGSTEQERLTCRIQRGEGAERGFWEWTFGWPPEQLCAICSVMPRFTPPLERGERIGDGDAGGGGGGGERLVVGKRIDGEEQVQLTEIGRLLKAGLVLCD